MKYKLYAIKDPNNPYYMEIRGIRFDYQYHLLPENAEWIKNEYTVIGEIPDVKIPDLFFKENGKDINFAKYKANTDFTDIIEIKKSALISSPRYIEFKKEEELKKDLMKELKKQEKDKKKEAISKIKLEKPELSEVADKMIAKIDAEE